MMTWDPTIVLLILWGWLFLETLWDFKNRDIPRWFSLIPLIIGLIHLVWIDRWLVAILMGISILGTHLAHPRRYLVVAAPLVFLAFQPGMLPLALGWSLLYLAWELGWIGGADALAGAYLLIWCPAWEMLIGIVFGIFVWHVGLALARYGPQAGLQIWVTVQQQIRGTRLPGMGAFLIALSVRMLLVWI